jgi:hypothetical protein
VNNIVANGSNLTMPTMLYFPLAKAICGLNAEC